MTEESVTHISSSIDDLGTIIKHLRKHILDGNHILLQGDLGAGKTTLVSELMAAMGCTDEISSPTYSIVNEYRVQDFSIYHMDLYRLRDSDELLDIGFDDYLHGGICIIEWPTIARDYLPENHVHIYIETVEAGRKYTITEGQFN